MPSPTAAPTVAVVITFYRNPAHVRKAVASVVRQTHPPNDVVLGDGAVPDGAEVLEELDPPVRILRHERNRGTGAARQMGLRATTAVVLAGLLGCHLEQAPRPAPPPDSNRQVARADSTPAVAPVGARLLGLRTVVYTAADIDSAKAWYQTATGVRPSFDEPYYVGFNIGGFELGITPLEGVRPDPGNGIAYWGVANIDSVWQHLVALGALVHQPIEDVGDGVRLGAVRDPFGNVLGVVEYPSFRVGWSH